MIVERVLLIRHGQTDWNAERRWQGVEPTPLNAVGLQQARLLAAYLQENDETLEAIHCSDLPRALQTATIIGEALDITPQIDLRWREINVGVFQGLTGDEVQRLYAAELAAWNAKDLTFVVPKGESRMALQQRAYEVWLEVIERETTASIAIVSHGGTIKALLRQLFGADDPRLSPPIPNTSITTLQRKGSQWHLLEMAVTPHLSEDHRTP
ncbi:MAG: histidine phosphatase family protein [Anaerolineae bacterium]|nr:histidine phosphatase family protein [Anaerolineae bacterium]